LNIQEFQDKYYEDGEIYGDDVKCIVEGDDEVEHKTVYNTCVYQVGQGDDTEYFEVTFSRSNSGYWGDSERYDPEFRKVVPVKRVVEITEWEDV
jgi:hypothetical protein